MELPGLRRGPSSFGAQALGHAVPGAAMPRARRREDERADEDRHPYPTTSDAAPMTSAPSAGPPRKMRPCRLSTRPRIVPSTDIWISVCAEIPMLDMAKPLTTSSGTASQRLLVAANRTLASAQSSVLTRKMRPRPLPLGYAGDPQAGDDRARPDGRGQHGQARRAGVEDLFGEARQQLKQRARGDIGAIISVSTVAMPTCEAL